MTDRDLISQIMSEAQRLNTAQAGPNPFESRPTMEALRQAFEPKPEQNVLTDRPTPPMAKLDLNTAIRLRWALRDIKANRLKMSPVGPDDLRTLIELGLAEVQEGVPSLTNAGDRAID
jgi:hypothetical protein